MTKGEKEREKMGFPPFLKWLVIHSRWLVENRVVSDVLEAHWTWTCAVGDCLGRCEASRL